MLIPVIFERPNLQKITPKTHAVDLDDWLTVHHSITFLSPTWCTNFLFIYI